MSANQSIMAVSIFVLVLTIPMSASVMRDSYWEKTARRAEVSDGIYWTLFACALGKERKESITSNWKKNILLRSTFLNMFSFKTYLCINHSQDGTFANQWTMAVSIFVLTKMTHMFASVMRVSCWEKMGKHAEVSTLIITGRLLSTVCRFVEAF